MIGIILQARTGSERLPKKVLMDIEGKPMIVHIIERLKLSKEAERIVIATTEKKGDDEIQTLAPKLDVLVFRGSENDVLDRFYKAASKFELDPIVRVTGDCPFVDPQLIDKMIVQFQRKRLDYLSNTIRPTFPDGLDAEVFTFSSLERAWKEAKLLSEREHVTPYIKKSSSPSRMENYVNSEDMSNLRWTVDSMDDLVFTRKVYSLVYNDKRPFTTKDVLYAIKKHPELTEINNHIARNEGYMKSIKNDRTVAKANFFI